MRKCNMKYVAYIFSFYLLVLSGCNDEKSETEEIDFSNYPYENFNEIDFSKRFAYMDRVYTEKETSFDEEGVLDIQYQGNRSYHPVQMFLISERFFHSYRFTGEEKYIEICDRQIEALLKRSARVDDAIYFTYDFDFQLHGNKEVLKNPWYSGMAQGYALTLFSRLYTATGNDKYIVLADSVLNSYKVEPFEDIDRSNPWISYLDNEGNLWLSEYPTPDATPTQALNGFIFSASGLYEMYIATKNPEVKEVLNRALLTLRENIDKFRNEGGISFYCSKHKVKSEKYHFLHIKQFQFLYDITSDSTFLEYKSEFTADYN